ncbi:MAG TPA: hypothetical protein DGH68_03465 [Bacteroidetes bacterium]|nr:hypothetical protein [Bacteroidota bacterium]
MARGHDLRVHEMMRYLLWLALIGVGTSSNLSATVLRVPNNYATISAAVTAASTGDTIRVYAGTYAEHVNITKSVVLIGSWPDTATIISAPGDFFSNVSYRYQTQPTLFDPRAALVRIAPGTSAVMQGFVVDGGEPNRDTSTVAFTGILVDSASATVKGNKVMGFLPSDTSGTPSTTLSGRGIEVLGGSTQSTIDSNTISTCQRYHIHVSATDDKTTSPGLFPKATVSRNIIIGLGKSKLGQKGIWYNWGAYGTINNNTLTQFDYIDSAVEPDRASAIVVKHGEYRAGGKSRILISANTISANTLTNNKGIFIEGSADSVVSNTVSGFRWNVQVDDQDSAYVIGNTITGGTVGVLVTATTGSKTVARLVTVGGSPANKNTITGQPTTAAGGAAIQLVFREQGLPSGDGEFLSAIPVVATYNDFGVYSSAEIAARIFDRADTSNIGWPASIDTVLFSPFYVDKIRASVKVFLQGPYDLSVGADTMKNALKAGSQLALHFGVIPIPALAVDSINIELRNAALTAGSTTRKYAPAWLLTNGTIRNFSDTTKSYVEFDTTLSGSYYFVVYHRSHLAVMCSLAQSLDGGTVPAVYNFTTSQSQAYGTNPMKAVGSQFALVAGNTDGNSGIGATDLANIRSAIGSVTYNVNDVDMNGGVGATDLSLCRTTVGLNTQVP